MVWYSGGSVPAVMSLANTDMQSTVPQISQKLDALRTMCQNLTHLWQVKKMKLEQCFQLRLFESDIEKVVVKQLISLFISRQISHLRRLQ